MGIVQRFRDRVSVPDRLRPGLNGEVGLGELEATQTPLFVMVGSLSGVSHKDALAYARGMAERHVSSLTGSWIRVKDDRANNRCLFEIQEGGPGRSILERVIETLDDGGQVRIKLANNSHVSIELLQQEIYSLIHSDEEEVLLNEGTVALAELTKIMPIEHFMGDIKLEVLYPQKRSLPLIGAGILVLGLCAFGFTGASYVLVNSGVLNADIFLTQAKKGMYAGTSDNPVWQLEKAKNATKNSGQYIAKLTKTSKGWAWELK